MPDRLHSIWHALGRMRACMLQICVYISMFFVHACIQQESIQKSAQDCMYLNPKEKTNFQMSKCMGE